MSIVQSSFLVLLHPGCPAVRTVPRIVRVKMFVHFWYHLIQVVTAVEWLLLFLCSKYTVCFCDIQMARVRLSSNSASQALACPVDCDTVQFAGCGSRLFV